MTWPASEVASLSVNGQKYEDWESVWVQERWTESFSFFKFTAQEGRNLPNSWHALQVKPGDDCTISLGGVDVIDGTVITRQASYNANQHMVQITGKSFAFWPYKSSVFTKDGNFDGKNFKQIADIVLAPWGGPEVIGKLDSSPFKKEQAQIGQKIWDYLEHLAREKGIILGVNRRGKPLLIGKHAGDIIGQIADGDNILSMQATITCEDLYYQINVTAQNQGDNENNGKDAAEIEADAFSKAPKKAILVVPMEHPPADQAAVQLRADYEKQWTEATQITANATVQGWFAQGFGRVSGGLWEAGKDVMVRCPMSMLNGAMKIKTVTFAQDNNAGTTTTLELVGPWGLNDTIGANVSDATDGQSPSTPSDGPVEPTDTGHPYQEIEERFPGSVSNPQFPADRFPS